jgi:hypothetical protein
VQQALEHGNQRVERVRVHELLRQRAHRRRAMPAPAGLECEVAVGLHEVSEIGGPLQQRDERGIARQRWPAQTSRPRARARSAVSMASVVSANGFSTLTAAPAASPHRRLKCAAGGVQT